MEAGNPMIVPKYWSESKTKKIVNGRSYTIKRFGWSDQSEQDAKFLADKRLNEAVEVLLREGDVRRLDHKVSYNGAEGIPIREEVISNHDDVVISRNGYGALCLNTPDVLFADIDFENKSLSRSGWLLFNVLLVISCLISGYFGSWLYFAILLAASMVISSLVSNAINSLKSKKEGDAEEQTKASIKQFSEEHPDLYLRLYRTPNGFRDLVMNDTFDPESERAVEMLSKLNSDKTYIQMCRNQKCFRARLSPKPWRIGMDRLRPSHGVWPINENRMSMRRAWVKEYEIASKSYSACRFVESIGSGRTVAKAEAVRKLHDEMCRAGQSALELA